MTDGIILKMDERSSERSEETPHLPKGWVWTRLEDFTDIILGQSPRSSTYNENGKGVPFYQGKTEFGKIYPTPQKWCTVPKKIAEKGDVLISVRAPVGPTNICPDKSVIGRGLAAIRGLNGIQSFFVLYLIRAFENDIASKGTGSTFSAISGNQLKQFVIPLAPLPEQRRIVTKIEELFSDLDAGVAALKKTQAQLKRYRQAVLKAAVEGKLTAEWRKAHRGEIESAEKLLERIRAERAKSGKGAGARRGRGEINAAELGALPEGWEWTRLDEITNNFDGRRIPIKDDKRSKGKYPYYGAQGIIDYIADFIFDGEFLLVAEDGANLFSRVKPIAFQAKGKFWVNNHAHIMQSFGDIPLSYLEYALNALNLQMSITGTAQPKLTQAAMNKLPMPLPPLAEQQQIVAEVERRLSVADEIAKAVDASLKQAERLRQSILKRAFAGKLVPQDPSDEPAEKLLERIRATREKGQAQGVAPTIVPRVRQQRGKHKALPLRTARRV